MIPPVRTRTPSRISGHEYQPLSGNPSAVGTEAPIRPHQSEVLVAPFRLSKCREDTHQDNVLRTISGRSGSLHGDHRGGRKRKLSPRDKDDTSCSGSELDSSDSENDSDSELEYDPDDSSISGRLKNSCDINYTLPPDHEYQSLRDSLMQFIYGLLRAWVTSVRYIIPPDHRIWHRKKRTKMVMYIEESDPNDPDVIIISAFHGYYHLACPFYISNTARHRRCALQHSLRSIQDVVDHIEQHHIEPPFCHICGKQFDGFKSRNDHIRRDICDRRDDIEMDGASFYQRAKILKRDDPDMNEEDRWRRIYATLFRCKPSVSPYLMQGEALKFSLLQDYWSENGKDCVRQYLSDHGHGEGQTEDISRELNALCSLVFDDLAKRIESEQEVSWE